jgi:hypothetical protein
MSITYNKTKQPIAFDTQDERMIYIDNENDGPLSAETDGKFILQPQIGTEAGQLAYNLYIVGASGDGKSTAARDYALTYKQKFPKNSIYLFTISDESKVPEKEKVFNARISKFSKETYADYLNLNRTYLNKSILKHSIKVEFYKNSLVIFDDFLYTQGDTTKQTKEIMNKLCNTIIEFLNIGRKLSVSVIITSHLLYENTNQKFYQNIWGEIHCLIFGKKINKGQLRHVFDIYFSLTPQLRTKILNFDRTEKMIILNRYPYCLISTHKLELLQE